MSCDPSAFIFHYFSLEWCSQNSLAYRTLNTTLSPLPPSKMNYITLFENDPVEQQCTIIINIIIYLHLLQLYILNNTTVHSSSGEVCHRVLALDFLAVVCTFSEHLQLFALPQLWQYYCCSLQNKYNKIITNL